MSLEGAVRRLSVFTEPVKLGGGNGEGCGRGGMEEIGAQF